MQKIKSSIISLLLITTLATQVSSCGYLLHPEARGQKSGKVDWAIFGLDSIGLLFFIVPGVIAFAVDVYSGTIYIPHSTPSKTTLNWDKVDKIKIDPKNINQASISAAIKHHNNVAINFTDPKLQIFRDKKLEMKLAKN